MSKYVYLVSSTCPKGKEFGVVRVFSCFKAAKLFCVYLHGEFSPIRCRIFKVRVCTLNSDFTESFFNLLMLHDDGNIG